MNPTEVEYDRIEGLLPLQQGNVRVDNLAFLTRFSTFWKTVANGELYRRNSDIGRQFTNAFDVGLKTAF